MRKRVKAVFEDGALRLVDPVELHEGERLDVISIGCDKEQYSDSDVARLLMEIAALPLADDREPFCGEQHDQILYRSK